MLSSFYIPAGSLGEETRPIRLCQCKLEPESQTGHGIRKVGTVAAFKQDAHGGRDIQAETAETTVCELEVHFHVIEALGGNTGERTGMEFDDPRKIEAQGKTGRNREIQFLRIRRMAGAEVYAGLQAAIQMGRTQARDRYVSGDQTAEAGQRAGLDGNHFRTGSIRTFNGGKVAGNKKPGEDSKDKQTLFHRTKLLRMEQ